MFSNLPAGVTASYVERASSTMDLARSYEGASGFPHWIVAGKQSHGRGRRGRGWLSGEGAFMATLVTQPNCPPAHAALRSFVAACALRQALSHWVTPQLLQHKWPNDVLLNSGKVAGILLESHSTGHVVTKLSVGIGVNLGSAPEDVPDAHFAPTGVADHCANAPTVAAFLPKLAQAWQHFDGMLTQEGFSAIRDVWMAHAARLGQDIRAQVGTTSHVGRFDGIDGQGSLVLLTSTGQTVIPAADVFF